MKSIIFITILFFLTSCIPKETHIVKSYDLSINVTKVDIKKRNMVLKIKYPNSLGAVGGSRIFYKDNNITSYYLYSRWISSLNNLIYKDILKYLTLTSKYKIVGYSSGANYDRILEINIVDFYHIIKKDKSYAYITIDINILTKDNKLIKKREFTYNIECKKSAKSFVKSANKALNIFLSELKAEL